MKYLVFGMALAVGVPAMAFAAGSARQRGWLLGLLLFSTVMGDMASINFISMETYRGPDRGFEVTLTDLIAWGLILGLTIRFPTRLCWVPYNSLWIFAFFGLACWTTVLAPDRLIAGFTLFKFLRVYAVFWCVVNCLRVGASLTYVRAGLVAVGALMTGLALKQRYLDGIIRISGPFDHSNTIPSYLNLVIPLLLIWALCDRHLSQAQVLASVAAVFGMAFSVTATLSRAGLVLAAGGLAGGLVWANLRAKSHRVTAVSLLVCLAMAVGSLKAADTMVNRFQTAPEASEGARDEFAAAAAMMVRDHPMGVGLNSFSHVLTATQEYRQHFVYMAGEAQGGVVHHIYLLTLAEMGYAGLAVFALILARFAWLAGRHAWRSRELEGDLLFGLLLGLCALYFVGFLEWTLRITPVFYLLAICAGLCVALAETVRQRRRMQAAGARLAQNGQRAAWLAPRNTV